jgi:iron-sulfur cluster assembly accessory protein
MNTINLTPDAITHFGNVAEGKIIKFGIIGGGCSGFQYHWEVYDEPQEHMADDEQIQYDKFLLSIDSYSVPYLVGSTVNYISDITGSRIDISNPNSAGGCGCGSSVNFDVE